jgi:hypothetical protein
MPGLNDLLSDSITSTTTLPSWYSDAQKSAVNLGTTGAANMPSLSNTVAGTAISNLSGDNNPYLKAQGTLSTIAEGAANPWIIDPATGAVKPNTNTAMGGLFSAQNDQLHKLLPQYESPATAGAVAGGNFGSLRGNTAANTALTNAQADLFTKQMQAALGNQATGVSAATGLSNVGTQGTQTMTELGKMQQSDPMQAASALATLLGSIKAPATVTEQGQLSPLSQMETILKLFGTSAGDILGKIFKTDKP